MLAIIGQRLDDNPCSVIYLGPTQNNVDSVIAKRIQHMLESVPSLAEHLPKGKTRKLVKVIKGLTVRLAWAGSPTEVASQSAGLTIADEVDRMQNIKGEGDPVAMLEKRSERYIDGTNLIDTTPTLGNIKTYIHPVTKYEHWEYGDKAQIFSRGWIEWRAGTRHEFMVPCANNDCGKYFSPRFQHCHWPKDGTPLERAEAAFLSCPRCGHEHYDNDVYHIRAYGLPVAPGQWIEDGDYDGPKPDAESLRYSEDGDQLIAPDGRVYKKVVGETPKTLSYSLWASGVLSKDSLVSRRVYDWLKAVDSGDVGQMQVAINTGFGELFASEGERPESNVIDKCEGSYERFEVPDQARMLFMGVDVQRDRFEYVVRAYGYKKTSWLIDQGEIEGDTESPETWELLEAFFDREIGGRMIQYMAIDAGFLTERVDEFAAGSGGRIFSVMSESKSEAGRWWYERKPESDKRGKPLKKANSHRKMVNSGHFKSWLYDRYTRTDEHGRFFVYKGIDDDYKKQITAEARTPKRGGGWVWHRLGANHKLDCEMLCAFLGSYFARDYAESRPSTKDVAAEGANVGGKSRKRYKRRKMKTLNG